MDRRLIYRQKHIKELIHMSSQTNAYIIDYPEAEETAPVHTKSDTEKKRLIPGRTNFLHVKSGGYHFSSNVAAVPVSLIEMKREKACDPLSLAELADSIREYGVLQPISVRIAGTGYELIAGARRLQAAKLAGLTVIPAMIYNINENDSAVMSLLENLQRENLHFIEEAEAYYCLMMEHGITQEDLAYRLGKSQSTIANKIRLLKLPPLVKKIISESGLSERHARALLRINDEQLQLRTLKTICSKNFNVSKTEQLVSRILERKVSSVREEEYDAVESEMANDSYQLMIYEIKSFVSDLRKNVESLKKAGVIAKAAQFDKEEYLEFVVRIPKNENGMKKQARTKE